MVNQYAQPIGPENRPRGGATPSARPISPYVQQIVRDAERLAASKRPTPGLSFPSLYDTGAYQPQPPERSPGDEFVQPFRGAIKGAFGITDLLSGASRGLANRFLRDIPSFKEASERGLGRFGYDVATDPDLLTPSAFGSIARSSAIAASLAFRTVGYRGAAGLARSLPRILESAAEAQFQAGARDIGSLVQGAQATGGRAMLPFGARTRGTATEQLIWRENLKRLSISGGRGDMTPEEAARLTASTPEARAKGGPARGFGPDTESDWVPTGRKPGGPLVGKRLPPDDPYGQLQRAIKGEDDPVTQKVLDWAQRGRRAFIDPNAPLTKLTTSKGESVHAMAQVVSGAQGHGENILRRFYAPVIKSVGNDTGHLQEYLFAKTMEDVLTQNPSAQLPGGVQGWQGVFAIQDGIRKTVGTQRYAAIEKAARDLWDLNDTHVLQARVRAGLLDNEGYAAIKSTNPHYFPLTREEFDDVLRPGAGRGGPASVSTTGMQRRALEGSTRSLSHRAFQQYLGGVVRTQTRIAQNRAAAGLVDALEVRQRLGGEEMVRYIEPRGALRLAERVTGETRTILSKAEHSKTWETVSFFRNGQQHTVEVPAIFGQIAKGLEDQGDHWVLHAARILSVPLRHGAITFNSSFIPVNLMRDALTAAFREKVIPFGPDYWAGMVAALRKNALFDEAAESGVLMSGIVESMTAKAPRDIAGRLGGIQLRNAGDWAALPFTLIKELNIVTERGIRLATFRKLRNEGVDQLAAAVRAKDVTVDFSKMGHAMRAINSIIPFSNAATQGSVNILRTVKEHPKWATFFGFMMAVPTILSRFNNMRFETSDLIPDYEYASNWVVQLGEGTRLRRVRKFGPVEIGMGEKYPIYVKIPKGEVGAAATFIPEVLFNMARASEDRGVVEVLLDTGIATAKASIPFASMTGVPLPPLFDTLVGLQTNQDLFTGAPVVPRREQGRLEEQQFGPETSALAVALGKATGTSPRKWQFAIKDYFGGAGAQANWLIGMAMEAAGYQPEVFGGAVAEPEPTGVEALSNVPGISRFLGTKDTQLERVGWDRFGKASEDSNRAFAAIPGMNALGVRLGEVPDTVNLVPRSAATAFEITPEQRAQYQELYASLAMPVMKSVQLSQDDPARKRKLVMDILSQVRALAQEQFLDSLPRPKDPTQAAAWDFHRLTKELGYYDILKKHPLYAADPDISQWYHDYQAGRELPPDAKSVAQSIDRDVRKSQKAMIRANRDLELGLVWYLRMAPVTRDGEIVQKVRQQEER